MKKFRNGPAGGQGEAEGAAEAPAQVHRQAEAGAAGRPPVDVVGRPARGLRRGGELWSGFSDFALKGTVMRMLCAVFATVLYI